MIDVKVNLTIQLPGATMIPEKESLRYSKQLEREVPDWEKNDISQIELGDGKNTKIYKVFTRKSIPARQVIQLSEATYNYMVGNEKTKENKDLNWSNMSAKQRLIWHCNQIAESLGGKVINISIID